jgi:CDP-glucose 4,6-dehydratase
MSETPEREGWRERRVLVTGATGIVGSWVVRELVSAGAFVVALVLDADPQSDFYRSGVHRKVTVVNGALEDELSLERAIAGWDVDTVLHLGAQTLVGVAHRAPLPTFESNIRGTYNLLEVCRRQRSLIRAVVVASSDKAYGEHETLPYTEAMPLQGRHPYEVSKSCTDLIAQCYAHTYGLPVGIARCGNIYGGGDLNWSRVVPGTIRSLHFRQRPLIRSDGLFVRDYIYIGDVVQAYLALAQRVAADSELTGQAFNFSTEIEYTVLDIVEAIRGVMGSGDDLAPEILNEARGEIRRQHLSAAKAHAVLGWHSRFSLEDGLRETVQWYREFFGAVPA